MDVRTVKLALDSLRIGRRDWSISADGSFDEGVHLVCGDVGTGKTSLALAMAGLSIPDSGSVLRHDIDSAMISFQFPEYHLTGSTLFEECRSWGVEPGHVLSKVHLSENPGRDPLSLSRGEMKRLNLACVMDGTYDLLILDEPFSSLDVIEKERICSELSCRTEGITIIFTHEQSIFPRIDFLWEIIRGSLVYRGRIPEALPRWHNAPALVRRLITCGKLPQNITKKDLVEAACRT